MERKMMSMGFRGLVAVALASLGVAGTSHAAGSLSLSLGGDVITSEEQNESANNGIMGGVTLDFLFHQQQDLAYAIEIEASQSFLHRSNFRGPGQDLEWRLMDYAAGVRMYKYNPENPNATYVGAGVAFTRLDLKDPGNTIDGSDSSLAAYVRVGSFWKLGGGMRMGFDVRYRFLTEYEFDYSGPNSPFKHAMDGWQTVLTLGWTW